MATKRRFTLEVGEVEHAGDLNHLLDSLHALGVNVVNSEVDYDCEVAYVLVETTMDRATLGEKLAERGECAS